MATKNKAAKTKAAPTKKATTKQASPKKATKKTAAKGGGRTSAVSVIGRIARGVGHALEDVAKGAVQVVAVVAPGSAGKRAKGSASARSKSE
jgi:sulfite exporter TauE/SafE